MALQIKKKKKKKIPCPRFHKRKNKKIKKKAAKVLFLLNEFLKTFKSKRKKEAWGFRLPLNTLKL